MNYQQFIATATTYAIVHNIAIDDAIEILAESEMADEIPALVPVH